MEFQRIGERLLLRFASGEHLVEPLLEWLPDAEIGYSTITGIGAVRDARVSYWNATTQQYEAHELGDQMEIVSLIGNVTIKDGKPFLHIHVALGRRDLTLIGGHLNEMTVHPNLELWLRPEEQPVNRVLDEACGLYVMQLDDRP